MTAFEIGARYEWKYDGLELSGALLRLSKSGNYLYFRRDDGEPGAGDDGGWIVPVDNCAYLRRVSPVGEAVVAEGDRLFADGCVLCGAASRFMRRDGDCAGEEYCVACRDGLGGIDAVDAEITRRRALAQPVPPASEATAAKPRTFLDKARDATPKPDPYVEHRLREEAGETTCPEGMSRMDRYFRNNKRPRDALDRLALSRRRHLDQLRAELDRPVRRDAADWEVDDAEELYVS